MLRFSRYYIGVFITRITSFIREKANVDLKKVFIYAYDKINLGDDLFVHTLAKRYPNIRFLLWTDKCNKKTFQILKNIKVIDEQSLLLKLLRAIRPSLAVRYKATLELSCEAVVYIGGSIFIEYENWEQILTWWSYEALNRNFYILGANFGPYRSEGYRQGLAEVFNNVKDVCFRDSYSKNKFADVPSVRMAPDILFATEIPSRKRFEKRVFISVIDCKSKSEGDNQLAEYEICYLKSICKLILQFQKDGYCVTLSSFCKIEGDEIAIRKIVKNINKFSKDTAEQKLEIVNYNGSNAEDVLQAISDSDYVIATRFHAAILGLAAGKPVYPIIYSDKTRNVLADIGFNGTWQDLRNMSGVNYEACIKGLNQQNLKYVAQLKKDSVKHFEKLDEILK